MTLFCCSQQSALKEEENLLSQQNSSLANELAALQAEKQDLMQQCDCKNLKIKEMNTEVHDLNEKVKTLEVNNETNKKTVEDLEVSSTFRVSVKLFCVFRFV